jgi:hypothetical protein
MNERTVAAVLRANAAADFLAGIVLLSSTWNGLLDTLDLPQAHPALLVQIGGTALWGFAYLLWVAPGDAALTRHVSLAAAIADGLAAGVIAAWLIFADPAVGTQGDVELTVIAVVMAAFAVAKARIASRPVVVRPVEPDRG